MYVGSIEVVHIYIYDGNKSQSNKQDPYEPIPTSRVKFSLLRIRARAKLAMSALSRHVLMPERFARPSISLYSIR